MKKTLFFLAACLVLATSCKKNDDTTTTDAVSNSDAAEVVGSTLSSESGGAVGFIQNSTSAYSSPSQLLRSAYITKILIDSTFSDTLTSATTSRTIKYKWNFKATLYASNTIDSIVSSHTYMGVFDGPNASSNHQGSGQCTFTCIGSTGNINANWNAKGTYTRTGTTVKKLDNKTINHTTNVTYSNVVVNHSTKKIVSGNGIISTSGINGKGDAFNYSGTITFNGNDLATLNIGDKSYTVTLKSGDAIAKN
jgi:hypothetical protein